jgi:type IV pilus assembly protein PilE
MGRPPRSNGFTLIELMVALVVIAILAAVGYPAYRDQVRKGHRGSAQAFMTDLANREQQYLLDARTYAVGSSALTALNVTVPSEVSSYYTISISPSAATVPPTYTITATPISGSVQASDGTLTLDYLGNKALGGASGW